METTARNLLIALNETQNGDWNAITKNLSKHVFPEGELIEQIVSNLSDNTLTILDDEYPENLKQTYHMPIVLYYRGDINLLGSKNYKRLSVVCSRDCELQLVDKAINDISELPDDVVLITTSKQIIANSIVGTGKKKIILIKSCGLNQSLPNHISKYEKAIIDNGGLIITRYPADVPAESIYFIESQFIAAGLSDASLVVKLTPKGSGIALIQQLLMWGRDIMVYPTLPKWDNSMNNTLISEGAILVEDAEGIKREIYNK